MPDSNQSQHVWELRLLCGAASDLSQQNEGLAGQCQAKNQDVQVLFVTGGCFFTHCPGRGRAAVASPWVAEHTELYPLPFLKWSPGKGAGPALSLGSAKWHCQEKWSKEGITAWRGSGMLCRAGGVSVYPPHMHICSAWTMDMLLFCHCCCFSFRSFMEKQINVCFLLSPGRGGRALCSFLCKIYLTLGILCFKQ